MLLVHGNSIGLLEFAFHRIEIVGNLLSTVFTVNELWDVFQRTRAIQGVHGDEISKFRRLELFQILLHTCTLVLENTDSFTALEKLIGLGIVQWEAIWVQFYPVTLLHQSARFLNNGQRTKSQEIHLEQTGILYHRVVKLRTPHLAILGTRYWDELSDITRGNNHTTSVNPRISH